MNNSQPETDLLQRLRKLERSQTRYRAAFLCTAALAGVLCLTGAGRGIEDVIQAKSFEVVNDDAKVLARISSSNGKGEMRTFRADGSSLVNVASSSDESGRVDTFNADGKPCTTLSTSSTGSGNLMIDNASGSPAVQIGTSAAKHGGMWVYNADGKLIAVITAANGTSDGLAETYNAAGERTGHVP